MGNNELFRTALLYEIEQRGRGAQSWIAKQLSIDAGYFNGITKGKRPGSYELKLKIASILGISYESMLALGRWIQEGKDPGKFKGGGVEEKASKANLREVSAAAGDIDPADEKLISILRQYFLANPEETRLEVRHTISHLKKAEQLTEIINQKIDRKAS